MIKSLSPCDDPNRDVERSDARVRVEMNTRDQPPKHADPGNEQPSRHRACRGKWRLQDQRARRCCTRQARRRSRFRASGRSRRNAPVRRASDSRANASAARASRADAVVDGTPAQAVVAAILREHDADVGLSRDLRGPRHEPAREIGVSVEREHERRVSRRIRQRGTRTSSTPSSARYEPDAPATSLAATPLGGWKTICS